ncbi:EAL domain-containing protein [Halopseudomonas nanhaiensis]|uniref:EAL domain-containing protein n=1 Tax=Halopseudomonas nanhaiensis TaxID=2830842 RepID=UPI001CBBC85E|nr:EAL domain-containing protein [Halopseudomonas nanhaiensis]UAW97366.1 EAL domain-containing protein [Halopseudomonas nanhaiensis]
MSLVKQLSLAICFILAIAFAGSFMINLQHSRGQLQAQLQSHADDAASALALSLTPHLDDAPMVELMVSSMFDSGYFRHISIRSAADGRVLVERERVAQALPAPLWFSRLANLNPERGQALLMQGWQQFGEVQVTSDPHLAIESLWHAAQQTLAWLLVCASISSAAGIVLLRRQLRPLDTMARQAEAASRREYYQVEPLPRTRELRQIGATLNLMTSRLKRLFAEESASAEQLRRQAFEDALTGLPNRLAFERALASALDHDAPGGAVLALRVNALDELNQQIGSVAVDERLHQLAAPLRALTEEYPHWSCCRSRGAEFVMLAPGSRPAELKDIAERLGALALTLDWASDAGASPVSLGIAGYRAGDQRSLVLERIDQAIEQSASTPRGIEPGIIAAEELGILGQLTPDGWRAMLGDACEKRGFVLHFQAIRTLVDGTTVRHKLLARLPLGDDERLLPAGEFLPRLERLGLAADFDRCVVAMTLAQLERRPAPLAVSITARSLLERDALPALQAMLAGRPELCRWLTIEIDVRRVSPAPELITQLQRLRRLGCAIAVQHCGRDLAALASWATLGLAYIKVDPDHIRDLDSDPSRRLYLRAILSMARQLELPCVAEQVQTSEELAALSELGFHAAQGNAVSAPSAWNALAPA